MSGVAAVWVIIATVSGASLTCASAVETTRLQSTALSAHTVTVSASSLSREQFQQMYDGKQQPLVLRDVLALNRSQWVDALLDTLYQTKVEYDARSIVPPVSYTGRIDASGSPELAENYENSFASEPLTYDLIYGSIAADAVSDTVPEVETYEADFVDFVDSLYDNSDHYDNIYLMSEFLLKEKVESTGKALENDFILNEKLFEKNLFDYFPASIRPRAALIVGGVGARSFLHADPYEWTGWNYLLEGRKLWTFLPADTPHSLLKVRRNSPDAWDFNTKSTSELPSGAHRISAGWVSESLDLYKYKVGDCLAHDLAQHQQQRTADLPKDYFFTKSILNKRWLDGLSINEEKRQQFQGVPAFLSGDRQFDFYNATDYDFSAKAVQLVQEAGELVLIPPGMWHQVYHLEPSIAVASQYLNSCNKQRVFRHILQWCSGSRPFSGKVTAIKSDKSLQQEVDLDGVEFGSLSDEEQVLSVLRSGLVLKHGLVNGKKLFSKLLESDDS